METVNINQTKVEAFLGKVVGDFGSAFSVALSYIGDKLGLYKAMAFSGPMSSEELAKKSHTSERYIREWLINQAAGGYIEYDKKTKKYQLPDEHAVALTDEDSPFFIAGGFQLVHALCLAEDRISESFLNGKGMLWGEHDHNLFNGTERFFKASYEGNLLSTWLPAIKGIEKKLEAGILVADIGCGHGTSTMIMAKAFPKSKFIGFDNHEPSITRANEIAKKEKLDNVSFMTSSALNFNGAQYDFITFFDCLHDMGAPVSALKNCMHELKDDGVMMVVEPMAGRHVEENFNPVGRVYSGASVLCCTPNALASGGFALGTVATDEALHEVAKDAGFKQFRRAVETPFNRVFEIRK